MTLSAADSQEILQLVARADAMATDRDAARYAALFTADATMSGVMGSAHGTAELRKAVAHVWSREPAGTLHLTLNPLIDGTDSEVSVTSVMLLIGPAEKPVIVAAARVRQVVVQTVSGWRIRERIITI